MDIVYHINFTHLLIVSYTYIDFRLDFFFVFEMEHLKLSVTSYMKAPVARRTSFYHHNDSFTIYHYKKANTQICLTYPPDAGVPATCSKTNLR